jgi:hypothetical protein
MKPITLTSDQAHLIIDALEDWDSTMEHSDFDTAEEFNEEKAHVKETIELIKGTFEEPPQ